MTKTLCPFSKFSDIFGVARSGVHKYRFMNVAIIDYILTIISSFLLSYFTNIPVVLTTIMLLVIGIICHMLFGVKTSALKYLGLVC